MPILKTATGGLEIKLDWEGDNAYIVFDDGTNYFRQLLPLTAAQAAGTEFFTIKIKRVGTTVTISCDKTELTPQVVNLIAYGSPITVMEDRAADIFDIRVNKAAITKVATDYYIDDVDENSGNEMLPKR